MSSNCEWSILEKLLLTQAVYKYGENMWFQVARVLKQHGLIQPQQRQSDFFSQKNCQFQYYLLVEQLEAEKQVYRNNDLKNDMPVVVRIARQLYLQRIEEVKNELNVEETEFGKLAEEIQAIKSGKWDKALRGEHQQQENCIKRTSSEASIDSSSKRCRLEESSSKEEQVMATAIAFKSPALVEPRVQTTCLETESVTPIEPATTLETIRAVETTETAGTIKDVETGEAAETIKTVEAMTYADTMEAAVEIEPESDIIEDTKESQNRQPNGKIDKLPRIIIPEIYQDQSASPLFKLNAMTPDDEYFTSSETATPTSARRLNPSNSEQRQKAWQKNINLLWQEIANHKNGTMFMNPIKKSYAPLYDEVVKQPLYLKTIKNRVRDGVVKTTAEFERDVVLMLTNSLMYNKEGTEMYLMALEMLDDVREQIRLFKSADGYSVSLWENDSQQ